MDLLSDILQVVKLDARSFSMESSPLHGVFSARQSGDIAPYLSTAAGHLIVYHLLTEGRAYARLSDGPPLELTAGDIVYFPSW